MRIPAPARLIIHQIVVIVNDSCYPHASAFILSSVLMSNQNRLKISHDVDQLAGSAEGRVLVMKDKSVLDEEDSDVDAVEVEDLELAAAEKEAKKKRLAEHGKKYDPLDTDQAERGILSRYDDFDELENERQKAKRIDLSVGLSRIAAMHASSGADREYDDSVELPSAMRIQGSIHSSSLRPELPVEDRLRFQTDFYDSNTAMDFSTGFKKVKKEKKKRKIEKSDDDDDKVKIEEGIAPVHTAVQDDELYAQLARLRRQKVITNKESLGAEYIAKSVQRDVSMDQPQTASVSMVDFISRIDAAPEGGPEERLIEEAPVDVVESIDTVMAEKSSEVANPVERDAALVEEVVVDSGLAGALKFFQSRGFVEGEDHRDGGVSEDDIHLERRDEFGRSITDPKEAFKQLSWRFHGKKPGAKKQEKRLRKLENELKSLKNQ